jgi:GxxExxY protein
VIWRKEIRDEQTYAIIGAAMEVHRVLGCSFLEHVYHEALREEFRLRDIPFVHEVPLPIIYKSKRLETIYKADFVCFGNVLVELKALAQLSGVEHAQIINYLKATPHEMRTANQLWISAASATAFHSHSSNYKILIPL